MNFAKSDLDYYIENIHDVSFESNQGGMGPPDMFSFFYILNKLKPTTVIESGVWNGLSTRLIRKTLGDDVKIICIDPREVPSSGFNDTNENTTYYTGNKFKDFSKLELSQLEPEKTLVFFDCHIDAVMRLNQAKEKGLHNIFFNDNYPINCGSHKTLQHSYQEVEKFIEVYHIFPNIYPGKIKTGEGYFDCESFFENENSEYPLFLNNREKYRWNTFVKLKIIK